MVSNLSAIVEKLTIASMTNWQQRKSTFLYTIKHTVHFILVCQTHLAITFSLIVIGSWNLHNTVCVIVCYVLRNEISAGSDNSYRISLFVKIAYFGSVKVSDCLQWGSLGKVLMFCLIQLKIRFRLNKRPLYISCKFQSEKKTHIQSNKKKIAKKCLTNFNKWTVVDTTPINYWPAMNVPELSKTLVCFNL